MHSMLLEMPWTISYSQRRYSMPESDCWQSLDGLRASRASRAAESANGRTGPQRYGVAVSADSKSQREHVMFAGVLVGVTCVGQIFARCNGAGLVRLGTAWIRSGAGRAGTWLAECRDSSPIGIVGAIGSDRSLTIWQ